MSSFSWVYRKYVRERFPLPKKRQVDALEERIGAAFPPDYRRFLLRYNGGIFDDPALILPSVDLPGDRLTFLNGIGATHEIAELCRPRDMTFFDDNDPPQIIVIGRTIRNHLILLSVHPEDAGDIIYRTFRDSYLLAITMSNFFDLIGGSDDT